MSPADLALLRAVRERIATPERWVQGVFAGDRYGNKLDDGNAIVWRTHDWRAAQNYADKLNSEAPHETR